MNRTIFAIALAAALAACSSSGSKKEVSAAMTATSATFGETRTFDVRHELAVKVPAGARRTRIWFAMPQDEPAQAISGLKTECPHPNRVETDSNGNKLLYVECNDPGPAEFKVVQTFAVTRREVQATPDAAKARPLSDAERTAMAAELSANQNVIIDDRMRSLAGEIAGTETNPVKVARRIYDWELQNVDYWVKDPKNKKASPVGSSDYCLTNKTGNCTDFHSLWASLARARGIPTRIVYGVFLKKELDAQDEDSSYHCWPEFYASGIGWVPHDVAVADIYVDTFQVNADNEKLVRRTTADGYAGPDPAKVEYYFGNLDARRVVFSVGRDLMLNPPADAGKINALAKAYVEVDGQPGKEKEVWTRKLTYKERM